MRSRWIVVISVVAVCVSMMAAAMAGSAAAKPIGEQGGRPLSTILSGANEVPVLGDPDGTGSARITLNVGQRQVCYELEVGGIGTATAAHIHEAAAGSTGPVVVGLSAPSNGVSSGCVAVERDVIKGILQDPTGYYVNVHNAEFPSGALRGQLG